MSHVYIVLDEIVDSGKKEAKKVQAEDPVKLEDLSSKTSKVESEKTSKAKSKEISKKSSSKGFANKVFQRKAG